jgi:hypothetical protein
MPGNLGVNCPMCGLSPFRLLKQVTLESVIYKCVSHISEDQEVQKLSTRRSSF